MISNTAKVWNGKEYVECVKTWGSYVIRIRVGGPNPWADAGHRFDTLEQAHAFVQENKGPYKRLRIGRLYSVPCFNRNTQEIVATEIREDVID